MNNDVEHYRASDMVCIPLHSYSFETRKRPNKARDAKCVTEKLQPHDPHLIVQYEICRSKNQGR